MRNPKPDLASLLGDAAEDLLGHEAAGIPRSALHLPGPGFVDRVMLDSDRPPAVLRGFESILNHGRLAGTGYVSMLPVDQGVEHAAGASFTKNPLYFDPENVVKLALDGGCNAVASTLGLLGSVGRRYAHRIPFLVKLNHNELLTYPNRFDQVMFGRAKQAFDMGAVAVGATIYFGSPESDRQLVEVSEAFQVAHELGMVTVLWCYLRNDAFKKDGTDYATAADLTGQANHLGATIQADILKQKLPEADGGYAALNAGGVRYGKFDPDTRAKLIPGEHPIERCRYQVANGYMGRVPLISSGGASGDGDLAAVARTAVINKRAGGMGLITGRKAFMRPMKEGIELLNLVQDVYLDAGVTVA